MHPDPEVPEVPIDDPSTAEPPIVSEETMREPEFPPPYSATPVPVPVQHEDTEGL